MNKTTSQEMLAHAEKLCAQRGVRLTPQRLEVLRLMSLQQGAISAYDLLDLLREKESFFLYGAGFSYLFAEYLTKKLQVLGKTAFISGPGDSRNIFLSNAARYQVFIAVSRSGETDQVLDKARIAKNVGMTIVAFTRASANTLAGMADVHFALYDEAVHFAAEAAGVTSFESNLVLLMDLLLLEATG